MEENNIYCVGVWQEAHFKGKGGILLLSLGLSLLIYKMEGWDLWSLSLLTFTNGCVYDLMVKRKLAFRGASS